MSILENLHFDFKIEPAMSKLQAYKAAPTEMIAWIEKHLIYSYSTGASRAAALKEGNVNSFP